MDEWKDDLVSPLRVYAVASDDAIDLIASDIIGYVGYVMNGSVVERGSRNPALIQALPGLALKSAVVKAIPMAIGVRVDDMQSHNARCLAAFRYSCTAVENLPSPGVSLEPTVRLRLVDSREHTTWSDDELDKLQSLMGRDYMYEIGAVIIERSNQGKARSGVQLYTPQPFLERVLVERARLIAAQSKTDAGTDSSEKSPEDSPTKPDATSADPGDALAESGAASPAG